MCFRCWLSASPGQHPHSCIQFSVCIVSLQGPESNRFKSNGWKGVLALLGPWPGRSWAKGSKARQAKCYKTLSAKPRQQCPSPFMLPSSAPFWTRWGVKDTNLLKQGMAPNVPFTWFTRACTATSWLSPKKKTSHPRSRCKSWRCGPRPWIYPLCWQPLIEPRLIRLMDDLMTWKLKFFQIGKIGSHVLFNHYSFGGEENMKQIYIKHYLFVFTCRFVLIHPI